MNIISTKYFVYRHIREDKNEPFYIGIGTKRGESYSRAHSKFNRSKYWNRIINKTKYFVEILYESNDYKKIIEKEIEFIFLYGRQDLNTGSLCNLTDGGEGSPNVIVSEYTRKLHSKRSKGNKYRLGQTASLETKQLMSSSQKMRPRNKFSEQARINCRNGQLGSKQSESTKEKHRENSKLPFSCNKKSCILLDTISKEEWIAESRKQLADISPISIGTIKKLLNNKSVCKQFKKYKIISL